jgi:zinc protease
VKTHRTIASLSMVLAMLVSAGDARATPLPIDVSTRTLSNGLRVVLSRDSTSPTVGIAVYYDVGSRDEERGRSGFAHLFEHMMFEGSAHAPKGTFDRIMDESGNPDANGTTSEDRTNYYETLPSNALSVGLWLEADRMRALNVTRESFENQREVVLEERRQSYEDQPYGLAQLRRDALAYGEYYPYAHTAIGEPEDLRAATFEQVVAFHRRYYVPNNAVLAIAGDVDPSRTWALVQRYFGGIPSASAPERPAFAPPAPIERPIVETMIDPLAQRPAFWVVYRIPQRRHRDVYALELLASILGAGESSRLYRALVRERELCNSIEVGVEVRRGPGLLTMFVVVADRKRPDDALRALDEGVTRIQREGVTVEELEAAKLRTRSTYLFSLESNVARARALAEHWMFDGDPTLLRTELDHYLQVTPEDVQRVASTYLDAQRRVVLHIQRAQPSSVRPARGARR